MKTNSKIVSLDFIDFQSNTNHRVHRKNQKGSQYQLIKNPEASTHDTIPSSKDNNKQYSCNHQTILQIKQSLKCSSVSPFCFEMNENKLLSYEYDNFDVQTLDRFIPTRRLVKKQSNLIEENQQTQTQNQNYVPPAVDPHHFTASQIYKRFIINQSATSSSDNFISIYNNENFLKFNEVKRASILTEKHQLIQKKNQFDFTQKLLKSTEAKRKINKLPYKVLDAPALQDDFYLNLIDWGAQNFLAVGLSSNVYLWNGNNSKVTKLCDLGLSDTVTSVGWSVKGPIFTLGTNNGQLHLWDLNKMKRVRVMGGHTDRISSIAWNMETVCTGSRDKTILQRDPRCKGPFFSKLTNHKQQVCGLKWSPDGQQLCSGGNDNKLYIWNQKSNQPVVKYSDHVAAVKAVTWSPHQHGLLLSGGGTADKTIKFRNTLEGTTIKSIDTGSQVCNLIFSKTLNEFVSTHGFSLNEINVWKYPKMQKISTLTGHTFRVLYLAMSPDGSTVVTGAGDETLRFWRVFPGSNQLNKPQKSLLNIQNINIR